MVDRDDVSVGHCEKTKPGLGHFNVFNGLRELVERDVRASGAGDVLPVSRP